MSCTRVRTPGSRIGSMILLCLMLYAPPRLLRTVEILAMLSFLRGLGDVSEAPSGSWKGPSIAEVFHISRAPYHQAREWPWNSALIEIAQNSNPLIIAQDLSIVGQGESK